jgi:hypothetical protein
MHFWPIFKKKQKTKKRQGKKTLMQRHEGYCKNLKVAPNKMQKEIKWA